MMSTEVASGKVTDFSFDLKSPLAIVATCDLLSLDQAPILCGFLRAYSLTGFGARLSELPSRKTGFTALPKTLA